MVSISHCPGGILRRPRSYICAYCLASISLLPDYSGLSRSLATEVALQAVRGAAVLAQTDRQHPAVLRDKITSPAGMTIEGLMEMEKGAFRASGTHQPFIKYRPGGGVEPP